MKKVFLLFFVIGSLTKAHEIKLQDSIITSTTGFEEGVLKENKNVTIISKDDLQKKEYKNLEEVLRDSPNVMIQKTFFGPVIDLRGNGERAISRVKVLVDGISINPIDESMGTLPINTIPVSTIETIEIIPGGGAVLNGSGTAGGVVNIITKSSLKKNHFFLDYGNMSYGINKIVFGGGYNLNDKLYLDLSYGYLKGNGYRDGESIETNSFKGTMIYDISKNQRLKFTGGKFLGNEDSSNSITRSMLNENRKKSGFPIESKNNRQSYSLDYEYKINKNFTLLSTFYFQNYKRKFIENSKADYTMDKFGTMPFDIFIPEVETRLNGIFKENSLGAKIRGKYIYAQDKGELILGYDYNKTKLNRKTNITGFSEKYIVKNIPIFGDRTINRPVNLNIDINNKIYKETNGIYGLNKYEIVKNLQLTTGIRYEHSSFGGDRNSEFFLKTERPGHGGYKPEIVQTNRSFSDKKSSNNFAGELGLNYSYSDTGSFYGRYERGFISPMPGQITNKDFKGVYHPNNLKSEIFDTIEVGAKDFIGGSFISWSLFNTISKNEITLLEGNSHNPATKWWSYENIGKTRRIGTEIYGEQYFEKFILSEGLTYIHTKITEGKYKGNRVPLAPKAKLNLNIDYQWTEKISSGLTFNYIGSSEILEYSRKNLPKKNKISDYHFTDLRIQYQINNNFTLKCGINNIFNRHYNYSETESGVIPAPGRNYYLAGSLKI
ncbi:TonB-dependent receptor [Cetobacterium sp. SF1]|uniref:TonB-dependent receptor n=1 Tax=Cetobacterium sp. SF1 TaxID=3417654 RepID=UPI003CFA2C3F